MSEDFNLSFRENVIKEVVQTEDDFVKDMNLMISLFLTPILERGILSANEVQRLFSNIQSIVTINEDLAASFHRRRQTTLESGQPLHAMFMGDIFLETAEKFMEYKLYCTNQQIAFVFLEDARKNKLFSDFIEEAEKSPECRGLGLQAWLIKPLQRLCKYPLLLRELIKATPNTGDASELEWSKELQNLQEADVQIAKSVTYVNEESKKFELLLKDEQGGLEVIQATLKEKYRNSINLLKAGRKVLLSVDICALVKKKWISVAVHLCTDILLISSGNSEKNSEKEIKNISLTDVDDSFANRANCFVISATEENDHINSNNNEKVSYTLACSSLDEKRDFLKKVKAIIKDYQRQRFLLNRSNLIQSAESLNSARARSSSRPERPTQYLMKDLGEEKDRERDSQSQSVSPSNDPPSPLSNSSSKRNLGIMMKRNSKKELSPSKASEGSDSPREANDSPTKLDSPRSSNSVKGLLMRRKSISIHDKQPKPLSASSDGGETTKKKGIVMTTTAPSCKAESQSTSPKK